MPQERSDNIGKLCPNLDAQKQDPMLQCAEFSLISISTLACLLGAKFDVNVFGLEKYENFNETVWWRTLLRLIVISAVGIVSSIIFKELTKLLLKAANLPDEIAFALNRTIATIIFNFFCFGVTK